MASHSEVQEEVVENHLNDIRHTHFNWLSVACQRKLLVQEQDLPHDIERAAQELGWQ